MGWKETDEKLIRRGELVLDTESLKNHTQELRKMNKSKRGPHYRIPNTVIHLLAAVRYLYQMPYRQLEGFTRTLHRLVPELPEADCSGIRKRILRLPVDPYRGLSESGEPITIAVDSTGISVHKSGGWVERKHGKKKRYVKLHFAVRVDTHEVVSMEVTTDDAHDSEAVPGLLDEAERRVRVAEFIGDGAYDSGQVYAELERRKIGAVIKPRRNARPDTGPSARGVVVGQVMELGYGTWAEFTGYGRRWAVETVYSYDSRNRPVNIETVKDAATLMSLTYTYDKSGSVTSISNGTYTETFGYDLLDRLAGAGGPWGSISYSYDAVGNRLGKSVEGGSTVTYSYDSMDRLVSATGMGFSWDANGNMVYMDDGIYEWSYMYDPLNRLVKVCRDDSLSAWYTYDAGGRRVRSWDTVDGVVDYVYSGLQIIDEVKSGVHEKHVYAGSLHLASNSSGTIEYYHVDHLGSIRLKTNSTGGVIYESNYEPYGPEYGESGSEEFRYTGKQEDTTGLYYFGARYYDPVTGRFTTRDTVMGDLSDPQSLNRYTYCRNNPHKYADPDGRVGMLAAWLIGTIGYTVAHVSLSLINYEKNRNPLMTDTYHSWERNRLLVKETTRGLIKGGLITAAAVSTAVLPVPNKAAAITATVIIADQMSAPVSTAVAIAYDKITNGPCSAETHAMELFESTLKPVFTSIDKVKEKYVDPILERYPVAKLAIDQMYEDTKHSILYSSYDIYFDTSYDYVEQRRGIQ